MNFLTNSRIAFLAVSLVCFANPCFSYQTGDVLVESKFSAGFDGWTPSSIASDGKTHGGMGRLSAKDNGNVEWYFEAPDNFLGDQRAAFGGAIIFSLGHFGYDDAGQGVMNGYDVVIESGRTRLGAKGVFDASKMSKEYIVNFGATGWFNAKTGQAATNRQMVKVLSKLTALKIRGGYFAGVHEHTWISHPRLVVGATDEPNASSASGTYTRSSECVSPAMATMDLLTAPPLGTQLAKPFVSILEFTSIPYTCADTVLTVTANGELHSGFRYVRVLEESGAELGRLFTTAKLEDAVYKDSLVIHRAIMTRMTSDRSMKLRFKVEADSNWAHTVTLRTAHLDLPIASCFVSNSVVWPGNAEVQPPRSTGEYARISANPAPQADDMVVASVSTKGVFKPKTSYVSVVSLPSQQTVGELYHLNNGSDSTSNTLVQDTVSLSRDKANAEISASEGLRLALQSTVRFPSAVKLELAHFMYAPKTCFSEHLSFGSLPGLRGERFDRMVNSSFEFTFHPTGKPAGDALLTVVADISDHNSNKFFRIRSREQSGYPLGFVFNREYQGYDRTKSYVDHLVIPHSLLEQYFQDGLFEISIELDMARQARTVEWPAGSGNNVNLPAFPNEGVYTLKSLTLSYGTV